MPTHQNAKSNGEKVELADLAANLQWIARLFVGHLNQISSDELPKSFLSLEDYRDSVRCSRIQALCRNSTKD